MILKSKKGILRGTAPETAVIAACAKSLSVMKAAPDPTKGLVCP